MHNNLTGTIIFWYAIFLKIAHINKIMKYNIVYVSFFFGKNGWIYVEVHHGDDDNDDAFDKMVMGPRCKC